MPKAGFLIVGILILAAVLALTAAIVAAAPYIAIGTVLLLLVWWNSGDETEPKDKNKPP